MSSGFKVIRMSAIRLLPEAIGPTRNFIEGLFDRPPSEEDHRFSAFDLPGFTLEICAADSRNPASTGGSVAYIEVDEMEELLGRACGLGAELYRGPLWVEELGRTIVQIREPGGTVLGFWSVPRVAPVSSL